MVFFFLDTLETAEQLKEKRILRVLMNDFPQYLAVVSRLRQEIALIGSDGGVLSSTVVPQVQAVFPEGALQKRIRVGLQVSRLSVWSVCTSGDTYFKWDFNTSKVFNFLCSKSQSPWCAPCQQEKTHVTNKVFDDLITFPL